MYAVAGNGLIKRLSDGAVIPPDPTNRDYRAYLDWCDAGNAPEAESLDARKSSLIAAVTARLQQAYAAGYAHDFGQVDAAFEDGTTGPAGEQVLQTRDAEDRTNWLILESAVNDLLAAGQGAATVTFRTLTNAEISLPASDAKQVLVGMKLNGQAKLGNSWALKNAIRQAETTADLDQIDVDAGWPS